MELDDWNRPSLNRCAGPIFPPCQRISDKRLDAVLVCNRLNEIGYESRIVSGMQRVARLLMIFLIAGPPTLCRAGLLVRCCESAPDSQLADEASSSCCESGCRNGEQSSKRQVKSKDSKRHEREVPRKCSDCAAVCAGAFKPSDALPSLTPTSPAMSECVVVFDAIETQLVWGADNLPHWRLSIPYPASDLPLRI